MNMIEFYKNINEYDLVDIKKALKTSVFILLLCGSAVLVNIPGLIHGNVTYIGLIGVGINIANIIFCLLFFTFEITEYKNLKKKQFLYEKFQLEQEEMQKQINNHLEMQRQSQSNIGQASPSGSN